MCLGSASRQEVRSQTDVTSCLSLRIPVPQHSIFQLTEIPPTMLLFRMTFTGVLFAVCSTLQPLEIHILTPTIYPPVLIGAYVYTGPAFDTALQDIRRLYPFLNVTQHVIDNPEVRSCPDWEAQVDDHVASSYYRISTGSTARKLIALIFAGE